MTLDLDQAAAYLKLHPTTLQDRAKAGYVPCKINLAGTVTFTEEDLIAYMRSLRPGVKAANRHDHLTPTPPVPQRATYRSPESLERRKPLVAFHAAQRKAAKLLRTPAWADKEAIRAVYALARKRTVKTGIPHHVDHVIPLQGETVSGLHVDGNLRIITATENIRKKNHWNADS